ncbi:DUF3422 family protein [Sphingobium scionense]
MVAERRFTEHALRPQVVGEMQLRREPALTVPARMIQLVRLLDADARTAELAALPAMPGDLRPGHDSRHREARLGADIHLHWEQHSEASTVTLVRSGSDPVGWDFPDAADARAAIAWAEYLPGAVIRAVRLAIVADEGAAAELLASAGFPAGQLVTCHVGGGARIWTDFRIHDDGYGRMVVAANGLLPGDLARCVQRLQELGNYRNLALLGLPPARTAWADLDRLEQALEQVYRALAAGEVRDDVLLGRLIQLSADILSIDSGCAYRMSATAAYGRIVASRLAELDVVPIAGHRSLADFTERRLWPAVRTCAALTDRLALLNGRAAQFTALLRTRIETHIENQNGRLLASMDRSARMQLQLQQLVEGLSTVAVSYYALGLLSYPLKALEKHWPRLSATLLLGLAMPFVAWLVFHLIHGARSRLVSRDRPVEPAT